MRELQLGWRCARCGADAFGAHTRAGEGGAGPGPAARVCAALFAAEARSHSGLAYAAGFAGLVYLFWPSAAALASAWLGLSWASVALLWHVAAPVALVLGLAAGRELDRARWKVGRAQALLGYLLGLSGTLGLVSGSLR